MTTLLLVAAAMAIPQEGPKHTGGPSHADQKVVKPANFYSFRMDDIDGKPMPFTKFKGKTVLVVNVASRCGLTPQYEGLEALYQKYKGKGLVVVGFPANNFNGQEPGTNEEIKQFCTGKYNVTFPMMAKVSVNGEDRTPLYQWLIDGSGRKDDIEWNFAKFLVDKYGNVVARFAPQVKPTAPEIAAAVEAAIAKS